MKIVFTGVQGCGKGTQARLLVEKNNFRFIEMGESLRNLSKTHTPLGKEIRQVLESGGLVSPIIVGNIIQEVMKKNTHKNIILDGFIRNEGNKRSLDNICSDYKVIFFQLSKEKAIQRLLGRMYDSSTGETFPDGVLINPNNGNLLVKRKDDNKMAIMNRINKFIYNTLPVLEEQKKTGKVIEINADQNPDCVYQEIVDKLGL